MKCHKFLFLIILLKYFVSFSQTYTSYKPEKDRVFDLVHTKLKVEFNIKEKQLNGKAWITAKAHFYESNKLTLDAKSMIIHQINLKGKRLNYNYNNFQLKITLPKKYKKDEKFTVYIKYTARPEKVRQKGSESTARSKGLYFINTDKLEKNKHTQIWTQGAPESSSCWFPTIDSPNQKTSQEIYITVPNKFTTLSNGKLISKKQNGNNRTDYWKMEQKHAPYLFFMGIGEFEVIKDSYKNIPVEYYVEKEYASYAKGVFGLTPEMIGFFSSKFGVKYPWNKYSQIVCRDYFLEAMENTTAVVHSEKAYQTQGQLIDENVQENTIASKLCNHWFGNLVTSESWSNLALNESFANYGEYLWKEHKYGKLDADMHLYDSNTAYFDGQEKDKKLVRFDYKNKEDMFDVVVYNKGGAILNMLRNYLGDKAFFLGLKTYLTQYKYQSAEVHQLRLVFEKTTGKDLNWFFNQWFYGAGHPILNISYDYNIIRKTVTVNVLQQQANGFKFPLSIDIFEGTKKVRHKVFVNRKEDSFTFSYSNLPRFIQINSDGVLLCKLVENKTFNDYVFQLKYAESYMHRREALLKVAKKPIEGFKALTEALEDESYKIKILALENINLINKFSKKETIQKIINIATNNKKTLVKATAIETLGKLTDPELKPIFKKALQSESYAVLGKALISMYYIDKQLAINKSKEFPYEVKKKLSLPLTQIFIEEKEKKELPFIAKNLLANMFLTRDKKVKELCEKAFKQIAEGDDTEAIQNLVNDMVVKGKKYKVHNFDKVVINLMKDMIKAQKAKNHINKSRNIEIIKTAMTKVL